MRQCEPALSIRPFHEVDAHSLLEVRVRNREFLQPFEPIRPESHFTLEGCQDHIAAAGRDWQEDKAYAYGIFLDDQLAGRVALANVSRGAWQNATIGYFMDQQHNGKGYMTKAVRLAVTEAFDKLGLHRVQGAVMPRNVASIKVLEKAGFRYEGLSLRYLNIHGVWEDHVIYAITSEDLQKQDEY
ncbi:GNAT family N-acetyltransferase [Brevibacillus migulae]|uniref:GNAT family N-acetyltransferase n=1 Tax=Brevibacillus migulae TaxID=1644114 RepID=UPI001F34B7E8|nr:GNAT family protein [Brevibacillus migulae]